MGNFSESCPLVKRTPALLRTLRGAAHMLVGSVAIGHTAFVLLRVGQEVLKQQGQYPWFTSWSSWLWNIDLFLCEMALLASLG